jgi:hypothetical protein
MIAPSAMALAGLDEGKAPAEGAMGCQLSG